jgi:hypothetical protein
MDTTSCCLVLEAEEASQRTEERHLQECVRQTEGRVKALQEELFAECEEGGKEEIGVFIIIAKLIMNE